MLSSDTFTSPGPTSKQETRSGFENVRRAPLESLMN